MITQKGKGYSPAEENPGKWHGVGSFDADTDKADATNPDISSADSFSNTFGRRISELAREDVKLCAVTAAMKYGTGLQYFAHAHPARFFDVGIAEQHAVTMCSGLAAGGMRPVFCVYSTFLQRAEDQLIHDISLNRSDVLLGIDRAGLVGDDGETHQGIYDAALLSSIGTFTVASPSNYSELIGWTDKLCAMKGPRAVRYPRGKQDPRISDYAFTGANYDLISEDGEKDILLVTYGREFAEVSDAARLLRAEGLHADILKLNVISPLDPAAAALSSGYGRILFAEEGVKRGGIGEQFLTAAYAAGFGGRALIRGIEDTCVKQASVARQLQMQGLDAVSLYRTAKEL